MDEWRKNLFDQLVPEAARHASDVAAQTALEIALGQARSEVAYVLELARGNRVPAAGHVYGDQVWISLGDHTLSFFFDRKSNRLEATLPGEPAMAITFDGQKLVSAGGAAVDMRALVRHGIDATVSLFKSPRQLPGAPKSAPGSASSLRKEV